ncbi:hypothetical protein [Hymenobacter rubripertinctus]|uniref:hypothetical protein n=1 Tax=Hymenobacter rubripertinctus TaxID=2029981 RepID=UPI0011C3D700|nr:hypothetical protein [Hymenobacter rubripertinctus]
MKKAASGGAALVDYLADWFLFLSASIMRRIASSRLMSFNGSASSSRHTLAGSRSSNRLRKLTGAPVAGKFNGSSKPAIDAYLPCFRMRRSISSRVTTGPRSARKRRQASSAPGPWKGLWKLGTAEEITEFFEVVGDFDSEDCEFFGVVVISQS